MEEVKRYYVFDTSEDHEAPFVKESDYLTLQSERDALKGLLKKAYEHLEWIGYGDSYEREAAKELEAELDSMFRELPL